MQVAAAGGGAGRREINKNKACDWRADSVQSSSADRLLLFVL